MVSGDFAPPRPLTGTDANLELAEAALAAETPRRLPAGTFDFGSGVSSEHKVVLLPGRTTYVPAISMTIDGFPETHYRLQTMVSKIPLEHGASVSDHAVPVPIELTLVGSAERGDTAAYRNLDALREAAEPIAVFTRWAYHPEMVIVEVEPRERGPRGISFTMKLQEIKRVGVTPTSVNAPSAAEGAEERTDAVTRGIVAPQPYVLSAIDDYQTLPRTPDAIAAAVEERDAGKPSITGLAVSAEYHTEGGQFDRRRWYTATLLWNQIPNIDGYEVRWRHDRMDDWSLWKPIPGSLRSRTYPNPAQFEGVVSPLPVTGSNHVTYTFEIRARSGTETLTQVGSISGTFSRA